MGGYVATADNGDRALGLDLAGEERGGRDGAGRLAGELRALVEEAERVLDLLLGDEDALEVAADLERRGRPTPAR